MAGPVRHPIDTKALERYISETVPEIELPLDVKQFGFGQSNPTYQLTSGPSGLRYVLRKKPPGKLLSQAAHKVEREHRILSALSSTPVPVPRTYCLCEDAGVLGTPFYVMSHVEGRIFEDAAMPSVSSPTERTALWRAAVTTLAALHAVDADAVGLGNFGKKGGFYARQLRTWRAICEAQAATRDVDTRAPVGAIPHFESLLEFFGEDADAMPRDRATLVHGDYKIDNLVFHPTEARVVGILDWEMSTIGHPLSDLANLMHPFYFASLDSLTPSTTSPSTTTTTTTSPSSPTNTTTTLTTNPLSNPSFTTHLPGLPAPSTVLAWYATAAKTWDPAPEMGWAAAFSVFRLAAICQGIAARLATRQASSASARGHAEAMGPLGETAWELVRRQREGRGGRRNAGDGKEGKEKSALAKL
ncbi:Uu.00g019340.m01.CDS01 [Anthostomella pinea]|uniref:Uu.00g019340.m01.CDS01 n=1 Tax=Anthostomella pinea TaxID=933095 RepID=A0AAI8W064_9PEZI|nr:Uu.00g019340.m01.CDS01 [Anthostomella pinea]